MAKKKDQKKSKHASEAPPVEPPPPPAAEVPAKNPIKTPAKKPSRTKRPAKPAISTADIALRAYFISEKRRNHGLPGNEHHDWIEAERQLLAEKKKAKKKSATIR
jgi:hypothetical protein